MRPWLLGGWLVLACCTLALPLRPALAQQAPLLPDQQDPDVNKAIADYVAGRSLSYAGDCQLATAAQIGQICSLEYGQADQTIYVTLSVVQANGAAGDPFDTVTVLPAPPAYLAGTPAPLPAPTPAPMPALAQQAPLLPDQQDPDVNQAIADYVASRSLTYAGDCQLVSADQIGQICTLEYGQADQSTYVTLSVVQADGSAGDPFDTVTVLPAPPPEELSGGCRTNDRYCINLCASFTASRGHTAHRHRRRLVAFPPAHLSGPQR